MLSNPDPNAATAALAWTIQNARRAQPPVKTAVRLGARLKVVCDGAKASARKPVLERLTEELQERKTIAREYIIGYLVGPHRLDVGFRRVLLGVQIGTAMWFQSDFGTMQSSINRDYYLARMGWTLLRFSAAAIARDPVAVARQIERMYHRLET